MTRSPSQTTLVLWYSPHFSSPHALYPSRSHQAHLSLHDVSLRSHPLTCLQTAPLTVIVLLTAFPTVLSIKIVDMVNRNVPGGMSNVL